MERAETQDEAEDEEYGVDSDGYSVSEELARRAARLAKIRALAQPSQTDHLARTLHLVSPNLTTTVGFVLTGASLASNGVAASTGWSQRCLWRSLAACSRPGCFLSSMPSRRVTGGAFCGRLANGRF